MELLNIFQNDVILVALLAGISAQFLKIIINAITNKTISLERLFGDGGMPSTHSAIVTSAAIMVGLYEGFASPVFGMALVIAIIVMHDAAGVRREAGKHAVSIIAIVDILNTYVDYCQEHDAKLKTEKFKTLIGHTHLQVFFGAITGIIVTLLYLALFDKWYIVQSLFT